MVPGVEWVVEEEEQRLFGLDNFLEYTVFLRLYMTCTESEYTYG